ncbi:hypothetical protein K490DRAFT_58189 [Saccharata proteae CBS 121410]|uniref:FHA domain-containing protein n=1 Tax=Saccharata proteae CBS 121410 TaxID=1314787 RepID=A0A9P4HST2_9PEZI|nr:hypothetical protein K490DRAFT_58189 [Saccharata proteae CBS 121410]
MSNVRVLALNLRALSGDDVYERRIRLTADTPLIIGRASAQRGLEAAHDNAAIHNPVISREHATIRTESSCQNVYIKDLKSLHGTMVDGRTLEKGEEVDVESGAVLELGSTVVRGTEMHSPAKYKLTYEVLDVPHNLPAAEDAKVGYTADDLSDCSYDSDSSTSSNGRPDSEPTMQRDISDARQPLGVLLDENEFSDGERFDKPSPSEFCEATFSDLEEDHEDCSSAIPASMDAAEPFPTTTFGYTALTSSRESWDNYKTGFMAKYREDTHSTGPEAEAKSAMPTPPSDMPVHPTVQRFPTFQAWTGNTSDLPSVKQMGDANPPSLESTRLAKPVAEDGKTPVRPKTFSNSIPEIVDIPLTQDIAPAVKVNKRKLDEAELDEEQAIEPTESTEPFGRSLRSYLLEQVRKDSELVLEEEPELREAHEASQAAPAVKRAKPGITRQVVGHVASFIVGGAVMFGALATLPDAFFA